MAKEIYGKISGKQKRKGEKVLIIAACVVGAVIIALAIIGIVVGADSAHHREISSSIAENSDLKQQVEELNAKIEDLNKKIDELGGELAARPTVAPEETPAPSVSPSPSPAARVSPRE